MEAHAEASRTPLSSRLPAWLLGLIPLALIGAATLALGLLGAPGLGKRTGPPVQELAVERTVLRPGEIELSLRNDGPDTVRVEQVSVNDGFVPFSSQAKEIGHLGSTTITIPYPWIEGEDYQLSLISSTGATVDHQIVAAAETPRPDVDFYGLMALLGLYVGVIPVALGMLWLPFVRRVSAVWIRALLALTVGLLLFLAIDATLQGLDIANQGPQAFGGPSLVLLGALASYLALAAVDAHMRARRATAALRGASGTHLASLIAIGIGLHNLGEGLAIGSAYAAGALALGAFLVIGFALHNTTEGLAIVAPLAERPPGIARLALLGLVAGSPAVLGAWVGAAAFNPSVAAFLFGAGVGAIAQVVVQLWPSLRGGDERGLSPLTVGGIVAGLAVMYLTGLLVTV